MRGMRDTGDRGGLLVVLYLQDEDKEDRGVIL